MTKRRTLAEAYAEHAKDCEQHGHSWIATYPNGPRSKCSWCDATNPNPLPSEPVPDAPIAPKKPPGKVKSEVKRNLHLALEPKKFLLRLDEERESMLNYLLRSDDVQCEHIDLLLRVAVEGARKGNWLCMCQYLQLYCSQESKSRLGPLASFMEEHDIVIQGGNPWNAVEAELFNELYQLVRAFIVSYSEHYDRLFDDPNLSNNDKFYHINTLKRNMKMCLETHDWLIQFAQQEEA